MYGNGIECSDEQYKDRTCNGMDPQIFWLERPDTKDSKSRTAYEEKVILAKKICDSCVIQRPCLDDAVRQNIDSGVRGGVDMSSEEGKVLRRIYKRTQKNTE
jgi:hypothetical protein